MGVPQNIIRALCAVIRPDHFIFASYGPVSLAVCLSNDQHDFPPKHHGGKTIL